MEDVKRVFKHIHKSLTYDEAWVKPGSGPGSLLIDMFHANLDSTTEEMLPREFISKDASVRCIVTTVAFGMGIQIPDIQYVIHWGPPNTMLEYWQEVGRCARDKDMKGTAILYVPPRSVVVSRTKPEMINIVRQQGCLRKRVLLALKVKGVDDSDIDKACGSSRCCSFCNKTRTGYYSTCTFICIDAYN